MRRRVEAAFAHFPHRRPIDVPMPDGVYDTFTGEAAAVHADLFAEHAEQYDPGVAYKVERALRVTPDRIEAASAARDRYRERIAELMDGVDLLLTPTLKSVAPPYGIGDLELRWGMIELTFPFNAVGAPSLALPCGTAEHGLPASVQLVGRPGADAAVLAAGLALEQRL